MLAVLTRFKHQKMQLKTIYHKHKFGSQEDTEIHQNIKQTFGLYSGK